ncbi:GDT1-like protein 1 [Morus notabilis]|uniref:GDT1 family protein n=1 Tax=Morus notabilis TaxID=981085 RepID=W9S553_9ROSA|nr:GDT1-like protein 1 [Morus notabilis]
MAEDWLQEDKGIFERSLALLGFHFSEVQPLEFQLPTLARGGVSSEHIFGGNDLPLDDIAAVILLVYFGVSTLLDASSSDGLKAEDEQKEAELAVSEFSGNGAGILAAANTVISTFFLVFVAEWGDKSFFSTIALAAASSPLGVIAGALAGHGVATLLAVLGGSLLGSFLSEKAIAYIGGVLFLVFAAVTLVEILN